MNECRIGIEGARAVKESLEVRKEMYREDN